MSQTLAMMLQSALDQVDDGGATTQVLAGRLNRKLHCVKAILSMMKRDGLVEYASPVPRNRLVHWRNVPGAERIVSERRGFTAWTDLANPDPLENFTAQDDNFAAAFKSANLAGYENGRLIREVPMHNGRIA